jgi:phosphate transport system protein
MQEMTKEHTFRRYDGDLKKLHCLVLDMGEVVIQQIKGALETLIDPSTKLVEEIRNRELIVDRMEVEADAEISRLIARYSPVGSDLRVVISVSKSVTDLEGIGDEAVRIAFVTEELASQNLTDAAAALTSEIAQLGKLALSSVDDAVSLFEHYREDIALRVIENHKAMDSEFRSELSRLMSYIRDGNTDLGVALNMAVVAKSLERITHHAQNLAEYAIFEMEGVDIRESQGRIA